MINQRRALALCALAACATASSQPKNPHARPSASSYAAHASASAAASAWNLQDFKTLVTFGDSYTDDSRLVYFITHNDTAPPAGWVNPPNPASFSGGYPWPQFVRQDAGVDVYNYAVAGAVCSNDITPRTLAALENHTFPAVAQYEIPAFFADAANVSANGTNFFTGVPDSTVYSIWIGTNDLGDNAFLTDSQVLGKTIEDYVDCVYDSLQRLYAHGGRYFVIMNIAPLNLSPLYGLPGKGGVGDSQYWSNKDVQVNASAASGRMLESVATVNAIYKYRTPVEALLTRNFTDAKFALYNVHDLMTDIYNNPSAYLNGTVPLNVTGYANHCNVAGADCVRSPSPDSFLWYDELHPSAQTDRVIAREFVKVVAGSSEWATYW